MSPSPKKDITPYKSWAILIFIINTVIAFSFISTIKDWDGWAWYSAFFKSVGLIISAIVFSFALPSILFHSEFLFNSSNPKSNLIISLATIVLISSHFIICRVSFMTIEITEKSLMSDQDERNERVNQLLDWSSI